MQTMIEHRSLCELAAKPSTRTALVSSQAGWVIHARTGKRSAVLIAERSQAPRVFRKMETATQYLRDLGITRFVVEADPSIEPAVPAQRRRPDRSRALQQTFASAAAYDKWFNGEVSAAVAEADDPNTQWVSGESASSAWARRRKALLAQ